MNEQRAEIREEINVAWLRFRRELVSDLDERAERVLRATFESGYFSGAENTQARLSGIFHKIIDARTQ